MSITQPHKKKSNGVMLDDRGASDVGSPPPIHRSGNTLS
ncbi:hypothetical protein AVEN_232217-1, partial [Araneus ventricosus]